MSRSIPVLTVFVFSLLCCPVAQAEQPDKPNIVIINVDDLGYGDIGPFGNQTQSTPHLDRMAKEGRLLKSHYGAPVCSPSRASLMTGCYPKRALPIKHVLFPNSAVGLHPKEVTIAEVLKEAGYSTACVGKWHLGDQPPFLPLQQGFDQYFGIPYSNDMGTAEDGSKSNFGAPKKSSRKTETIDEIPEDGLRGNAQPPLPLLDGNEVVERVTGEVQESITHRYTERAIHFIDENKEQPFFLYFAHTAVHFPLYPSGEFRGRSKNGLFGDWVEEVDWSVGEILKAIKDADLDDRTLVIFTSDNGGATRHGASNTPLRGAKASTWEGGIRVPTIARWPGKISPGSSTNAITSMMDFLPTAASLSGGELPKVKLDGRSLEPVLFDDGRGHNVFLYFKGFRLEAIRKGPWKLILKSEQLFHLDEDVAESTNVAKQNPEIVSEIKAMLPDIDDDLGTTELGPLCRKIGRYAERQPLIQP